jgi:serine/threonine protein kinase HipA of HipAB toxin-antitoxin module
MTDTTDTKALLALCEFISENRVGLDVLSRNCNDKVRRACLEAPQIVDALRSRLEAELRMPEDLGEIAANFVLAIPRDRMDDDEATAQIERLTKILQHLSTPVTPTPTRAQIADAIDEAIDDHGIIFNRAVNNVLALLTRPEGAITQT